MQTNNKMAVAPVGKLIWQMSIPPLISMFLQYSYTVCCIVPLLERLSKSFIDKELERSLAQQKTTSTERKSISRQLVLRT